MTDARFLSRSAWQARLTVMGPLTTTLTNPAGDIARVTWRPVEVTGYDFQRQRDGIRDWAWATSDNPPVFWDPFLVPGEYFLSPSLRVFSADRTVTLEGRRVYARRELEPGCYLVED